MNRTITPEAGIEAMLVGLQQGKNHDQVMQDLKDSGASINQIHEIYINQESCQAK